MQKVTILLLLFINFSILSRENITPEIISLATHVSCFTSQNVNGSSTCQRSGAYCQNPMTAELTEKSIHNPYDECISTICPNSNESNIMIIYEDANIFNQQVNDDIDSRIAPSITGYFDELNRRTQNTLAALTPAQLSDLNKRSTLAAYTKRFQDQIREATLNLPAGANDRESIRQAVAGQYTIAQFDFLYEKSRIVTEARRTFIQTSQERPPINATTIASRIDSLPDLSLIKGTLLRDLENINTAISLSGTNTIIIDDALAELNVLVINEQVYWQNENVLALDNQIYKNISPEFINDHTYQFIGNQQENIMLCLNEISDVTTSLLPEKDLNVVEKKVKILKERLLSSTHLNNMFSSVTSSNIQRDVADLPIQLPPSREDYMKQTQELFKTRMTNLQRNSPLDMISEHSAWQDVTTCAIATQEPLNSYAVRASHDHGSHIELGAAFIYDFDQTGLYTLSHELGHIISNYIRGEGGSASSQASYNDTRTCLNTGHFPAVEIVTTTDASGKPPSGPRVDRYEEEDFADLFAFVSTPHSQNPVCPLFDNNQNIFGNSGVHQPEGNNNAHSTSLYRLLHWQQIKNGSLPLSCQNTMSDQGEDFPLTQSCWQNESENE